MHIGRVGSVFATLTVTVERFVAVMYPLRRLKNTKLLLSFSIVGSVVYNIPRFFEYETMRIHTNGTDAFIPSNITMNNENFTEVSIGDIILIMSLNQNHYKYPSR